VSSQETVKELPVPPDTAVEVFDGESFQAGRVWRIPWVGAVTSDQAREYLPTIATEFAVIVAQIVAFKLAAHYLGPEGFSEYAVARRAASLISALPLLGLAVGLPRYIAYSNGRGDSQATVRYYGAALRCVGIAMILCLIVLNGLRSQIAFLIFGDRVYAGLILPVSLMVLGLALHGIVYSYFRGHLAMMRANLLQVVNLAVVPIVCFTTLHQSTRTLVLSLGSAWFLVAFVGLWFTPVGGVTAQTPDETRELLRYGIQRLPGEFALMAMLSLPVIFVAHRSGVQQAGFVAFGISVLSMIGAFFTPIGLILLPKASALLADGRRHELRVHVALLIRVSLAVAGVATVLVWFLARPFVALYLGSGFEDAGSLLRLIVLGAVPYALFTVLRNLIDAFHRDAVTAVIAISGLAVFILGAWLGKGYFPVGEEVLIAFLVGLGTLGFAAWFECGRILRT